MAVKFIHVTKGSKEFGLCGDHIKGFCVAYEQEGERIRWGVSVCSLKETNYDRNTGRTVATEHLKNMKVGFSGEFMLREAIAHGMFTMMGSSKFFSPLLTPKLMLAVWNALPESIVQNDSLVRSMVFQQCVFNTISRQVREEMGV